MFGLDRLVGFNDLRFFVDDSGTTEVMHIAGDGKIGLGVTNPQQNLSVAGGANIDQGNRNAGSLDQGLRFGSSSGEGIASQRTGEVISMAWIFTPTARRA